MSPLSPSPRLQILHPSLFSTPEKTFHLPGYANAMAHQSITSNSSSLQDDFVEENPGVEKFMDICAIEDNKIGIDSEHSAGSPEEATSTSDSS